MKRTSRHGTTMIEVVGASVLLLAALTLASYLVMSVAALRREARDQQTAREEVANALQRLTAEPWDALTPERAGKLELSPTARANVASGELTVEIADVQLADDAKMPGSKRVTARFTWRNRRGEPQPPVQAVAWVYRAEGTP